MTVEKMLLNKITFDIVTSWNDWRQNVNCYLKEWLAKWHLTKWPYTLLIHEMTEDKMWIVS